ncbi:MAG: hypothetical protein COA47_00760 [Robiginitomaculum sp.]|nr:MAG: hypothetical protein COA47_00760 [Robiginitomaculum sp.]
MNTGPMIALGLIALILIVGIIRTLVGYWVVHRDAAEEWLVFQTNNSKQADKTSEEQFTQAYTRAHSPRGLAFATGALAVAALVTPLAVMALTFIYANVIVQEVDPNAPIATTIAEEVRRQLRTDGPLVYSFFLFFGLIGSWGGVAYVTARLFYRDDTAPIEENLRKIRGDAPLSTGKAGRKRPSWSPLVRGDAGLTLDKNLSKPKKGKEN